MKETSNSYRFCFINLADLNSSQLCATLINHYKTTIRDAKLCWFMLKELATYSQLPSYIANIATSQTSQLASLYTLFCCENNIGICSSYWGIQLYIIIIIILQRRSRLMLLSSCEEKFGVFLNDSRLLQEGAMIACELMNN